MQKSDTSIQDQGHKRMISLDCMRIAYDLLPVQSGWKENPFTHLICVCVGWGWGLEGLLITSKRPLRAPFREHIAELNELQNHTFMGMSIPWMKLKFSFMDSGLYTRRDPVFGINTRHKKERNSEKMTDLFRQLMPLILIYSTSVVTKQNSW